MKTGILKVTERAKAEINAIKAKLHLGITGENVLFGNAAIEKAKEIKELVEKISKIPDFKFTISVKSVRVISQTGWFSKSSKGVYSIVIDCDGIDKIGEVIWQISETANMMISELEWVFDDDGAKMELIKIAVKKCIDKGNAMVDVSGHQISHINAASDSYDVPNVNLSVRGIDLDDGLERRSRRVVAGSSVANIGTEIRGVKEITATASIEFVIHPKANAG